MEADYMDAKGTWYCTWVLQNRDSVQREETLKLRGTTIQGSLPFTDGDLLRAMVKTQQIQDWTDQFQSTSGNPIMVIFLVAAWVPGDSEVFPRLVTVHWPTLNRQRIDLAAFKLLKQFNARPLEAILLDDPAIWTDAQEVLTPCS